MLFQRGIPGQSCFTTSPSAASAWQVSMMRGRLAGFFCRGTGVPTGFGPLARFNISRAP